MSTPRPTFAELVLHSQASDMPLPVPDDIIDDLLASAAAFPARDVLRRYRERGAWTPDEIAGAKAKLAKMAGTMCDHCTNPPTWRRTSGTGLVCDEHAGPGVYEPQ